MWWLCAASNTTAQEDSIPHAEKSGKRARRAKRKRDHWESQWPDTVGVSYSGHPKTQEPWKSLPMYGYTPTKHSNTARSTHHADDWSPPSWLEWSCGILHARSKCWIPSTRTTSGIKVHHHLHHTLASRDTQDSTLAWTLPLKCSRMSSSKCYMAFPISKIWVMTSLCMARHKNTTTASRLYSRD